MSWFTNLRLLPKLLLSFAAVLVMTVVLGLTAIQKLSVVHEDTTELATNWLPSINAVGQIDGVVNDIRTTSLTHVLSSDDAAKALLDDKLKALTAQLAALDATYTKLISSPQEKAEHDTFLAEWAKYQAVQQHMLQMSQIGEVQQAQEISVKQGAEQFDKASGSLQKLIDLNIKGAHDSNTNADEVHQAAVVVILVSMAVAVGLGFALALVMARAITRPLNQVVACLHQVAQGDLTQAIHHDRSDELGDMQKALQSMIESLSAMVSQVRHGADSVATASSQIAQGNMDLSARTENQASSLQETAASVEQMSGTVRTNADNAHQANQLASAASSVAAHGGDVVAQVVDTMNAIQSSSRKISDIIGVIDGIAFQTNILALNAAVEAARAGEQGRGFAVVAGEVRSLAQRSAQAAREIKTLINDSVEKVNAGSALVGTAGTTMGDVVLQVRKVTDLVGEIAHASTEQSQGIGQINQAVSQLDQMTQQNAALVEQSMAAAESLKTQAERLAEAVSVFKTAEGKASVAMAQSAIDTARHNSAHAFTPSTQSASSAVTPVKPIKAAAPAARPAALKPAVPQLPSPSTSVAPASVGGNADDWETF
jgi:methyl-accepting chemotaxis protein